VCSSTELSANRNCSDNLLIAKSPQLSRFDCEKLLFANRDMRPCSSLPFNSPSAICRRAILLPRCTNSVARETLAMRRIHWLVWTMLVVTLATTGRANDGFRCETDVFVAGEKEPVQQSLTVFTGTLAYDFLLGQSQEITVYDVKRGSIDLLDKKRQLRTTIPTDELLRITALYKTRKAESDLFKFCTEPAFEKTFAKNILTLDSSQFTYRVTCAAPGHTGAERQYCEFADWSAQLNAIRPGNLPPFPRMELDKCLAAEGMLPEEIERTITTRHLTGRRSETVRSRPHFNWTLSVRDRELIEEVGDHLIKYKSVSVDEYLGLAKKMAKK
jgi:hypothetical protein